MWNYTWPILLVVTANTFYHICSKSAPSGVQPFAMLTITYLTAAIVSLALFFICSEDKQLFLALRKTNWTAFVLGLAIVGLEFGYLAVYRVGWQVSIGSLLCNISLACVLLLVGILLYREVISLRQLSGMVICVLGIILITKS